MLLVALAVALGTLNVFLNIRTGVLAQNRERLLGAARLAAARVTPADYQIILDRRDPNGVFFRRVHLALLSVELDYELDEPVYTLGMPDDGGHAPIVILTDTDQPFVGGYYDVAGPVAQAYREGAAVFQGPYSDALGRWLSAYAPIVTPAGNVVGVVGVDEELSDFYAQVYRRMLWVALFSGSAVLLGGALGVSFARRQTRPILELLAATERVRAGDYAVEVSATSHDEIGQLARAFNTMVNGLRERDRIKRAFGKYVSPPVAAKLLAQSDVVRLEGEKRAISVLATDIRGYTAFAEGMEPEQLVKTLNEYFTILIEIVIRYEGTIDKFVGDAVLAYFGAPLAQGDHRDRALRVAQEIQTVLATFNRTRLAAGERPLETGIGLAAGEVLVGNIGSRQRLEYTIIGDAVTLASRLADEAPGGHIYVQESMLRAARDSYLAEPLGSILVKGYAAPVPVCDVRTPDPSEQ